MEDFNVNLYDAASLLVLMLVMTITIFIKSRRISVKIMYGFFTIFFIVMYVVFLYSLLS